MIKLIATDIDGTLLADGTLKINPEYYDVIKELRNRGVRVIAGLENPNAGDIFIDGKRVNDIPAAKRGIGFVFQSYALFRYMTVFDNIAFGLEIAKMPKKQI